MIIRFETKHQMTTILNYYDSLGFELIDNFKHNDHDGVIHVSERLKNISIHYVTSYTDDQLDFYYWLLRELKSISKRAI